MNSKRKLLAAAGLAALGLGACDYGLVITPDPADPGEMVTVTNAPDGPVCDVPDLEQAGPAAGMPVSVFVVSEAVVEEPPDVVEVMTDDEGFFTAQVPAPDRPGQHIVFAFCGDIAEGPEEPLGGAAIAADVVDEDGVIVDLLEVTQDPLSISLSDDTVEPGDQVVATFNRCQAENDMNLFTEGPGSGGAGAAADPTPEELHNDFPDLEVFLDGELVDTIEGTERYPTGTVDVPITLDELGEHEIKGVCTFQTFDLDLQTIIEEIFDEEFPPVLDGASAAAIDYPFAPEGDLFVWDEATTQAADTVTVAEEAVGDTGVDAPSADPTPAQPAFTG